MNGFKFQKSKILLVCRLLDRICMCCLLPDCICVYTLHRHVECGCTYLRRSLFRESLLTKYVDAAAYI